MADTPPPFTAGEPKCAICGSNNLRIVSGGKMRCLDCGHLPSCADGDCGPPPLPKKEKPCGR